jgi:hypothetical protein
MSEMQKIAEVAVKYGAAIETEITAARAEIKERRRASRGAFQFRGAGVASSDSRLQPVT